VNHVITEKLHFLKPKYMIRQNTETRSALDF
jgi:hypothetical protein